MRETEARDAAVRELEWREPKMRPHPRSNFLEVTEERNELEERWKRGREIVLCYVQGAEQGFPRGLPLLCCVW